MENLLEDTSPILTTEQVYELAMEISQECERLVQLHGTDPVHGLICKVLNALQMLESLTQRSAQENAIARQLREQVEQLNFDKINRAGNVERYQKDLEEFEDQWRQEVSKATETVVRLEKENKRLHRELREIRSMSEDSTAAVSQSDLALLQRLRTMSDKLSKQNDSLKREVEQKNATIDSLQVQVNQLAISKQKSEFLLRQELTRVRDLTEEKMELLEEMECQTQEIFKLRSKLSLVERENQDLSDNSNITMSEVSRMWRYFNDLKTPKPDLKVELEMYALQLAKNEEQGDVQGPLPKDRDSDSWKDRLTFPFVHKFSKFFTVRPASKAYFNLATAILFGTRNRESVI